MGWFPLDVGGIGASHYILFFLMVKYQSIIFMGQAFDVFFQHELDQVKFSAS